MSFEIFKTNMTSFFLNTKESDLPTPTIEQEDPNNLGETIEVLDIDAELTKIARKITGRISFSYCHCSSTKRCHC